MKKERRGRRGKRDAHSTYMSGGEVESVGVEGLFDGEALPLRETHLDRVSLLRIEEEGIRLGVLDDELEGGFGGRGAHGVETRLAPHIPLHLHVLSRHLEALLHLLAHLQLDELDALGVVLVHENFGVKEAFRGHRKPRKRRRRGDTSKPMS